MSELKPASSVPAHTTPVHDHEHSDVPIRPIVTFAIGLSVFLVATVVLVAWMFSAFSARAARADAPALPLESLRKPPPEPRLQTSPVFDMKALRAAEDAKLKGYGWIVKEAGLVHLPIERAMELTVERGLPAREEVLPGGPKATTAPATGEPAAPSPNPGATPATEPGTAGTGGEAHGTGQVGSPPPTDTQGTTPEGSGTGTPPAPSESPTGSAAPAPTEGAAGGAAPAPTQSTSPEGGAAPAPTEGTAPTGADTSGGTASSTGTASPEAVATPTSGTEGPSADANSPAGSSGAVPPTPGSGGTP